MNFPPKNSNYSMHVSSYMLIKFCKAIKISQNVNAIYFTVVPMYAYL